MTSTEEEHDFVIKNEEPVVMKKKERRAAQKEAAAAAAAASGLTPAGAIPAAFNPKFLCRMYENKFPEVEDLVMVNVRQTAEMGAYVHLLEYNNIEGMILLSELSRRRIRSIQKLIRVGRNEVVVVVRVDKEKGYIDLSKRRVTAEDIVKCEEKYNKSKTVHSIMRHVAETLDMDLEELYKLVGWPLYRKFGHACDAFKLAITEQEKVFADLEVEPRVLNELMHNIRRRLTPQPVKVRADIAVNCFSYEGIDAIKTALRVGEDKSSPEAPIKIKLIAPPLYVMTTQSLDKQLGLDALDSAIERIEKSIVKNGGSCVVKVKPRAVFETDDIELAQLIARADKENAEVSGDDEGSDLEE